MNGLLLAAGLGTRFRPHTEILPKPAIPLLNVPIALYNVHLMQQLGLKNLTVNTHHLPGHLKSVFRDHPETNASLTSLRFSDEVGEILGTGGAIKKARKSLTQAGPFVVANADVVNGFGINDAFDFHKRENPLATMIVIKHPDAGVKYGAVWANERDEVVGISKEKVGDARPYHFVGLHVIRENIFKYIPDGPCDINRDVYLKAIAQGEKVLIFEKQGLWFDAGTLEDYLKATKDLLDLLPKIQHQPYFLSLYRRFWTNFDKRPNLWEGEGCEHLLTLGEKSSILLGKNCRIHPSVKVSGFAVFGDGAVVEEDCHIEDSVVGFGATVSKGAHLKSALIL